MIKLCVSHASCVHFLTYFSKTLNIYQFLRVQIIQDWKANFQVFAVPVIRIYIFLHTSKEHHVTLNCIKLIKLSESYKWLKAFKCKN